MTDPSVKLIQDLSTSSKGSSEKDKTEKVQSSNKHKKETTLKPTKSARCLKLTVCTLIIFVPFALTGIVVYTTYNIAILRKEYDAKLLLAYNEANALKNQDDAIMVKQDFIQKTLANFEYDTKINQEKMYLMIQATRGGGEPRALAQRHASGADKKENTKTKEEDPDDNKYIKRKCQIMHETIYGEFKPAAITGIEGTTHHLGKWICDCCISGSFALQDEGEDKLTLQVMIDGVYLIYVKIALASMEEKQHMRIQLSVDGRLWRLCALYGDRYVTCILSGYRALRKLTDVTLESKSGRLKILPRLSRIEIVKIMNLQKRKSR